MTRLVEMSLARRDDQVRMSVTYEGIEPLVIIISRAGSGPSLLETRHLSFRYEGASLSEPQERILRSIAQRLADATYEEVAGRIPEEREVRGPDELVDTGGVTVEAWGAEDAWRRFVFRREFERNASSALRVTGRNVITVSHGESECQYATPGIDARTMSLYCYPWIRPLSRGPDDRAVERRLPAFITTDMRDADIITGGVARLETVLDALAGRTREEDVVVVRSTCVPHVIGDDMEEPVRRWKGRGEIVYDDVFASEDGDLVERLLAEAIDRGKRRRGRPAAIALAGLVEGPALHELVALLGDAGIDVVGTQVPRIDLASAPAWRTAAVQVLVPGPYFEKVYERVLRPLPLETVEAPAPCGIAATRRWLATIAGALGREERMRGAWRAAMRASAAERRRVRQEAGRRRLGFVVDDAECAALEDPMRMGGVPVLGMVSEMGFGVDLMVHGDGEVPEGPGIEVHRFGDQATLERLLRELPCGAIYSDLYADPRIAAAGKMPFSLQAFEPGLGGALRTADRLAHACRADFYRKYRRHD